MALAAVAESGRVCQVIRSKCAILPPAVRSAFSSRGTYLSNLANAARLPALNSSARKRYGPEPTISFTC